MGGAALRASAEASHARIGGPGRWLLALSTDRIAGAQVLARSSLSGLSPVVVPDGPFDADTFATEARRLASTTDPGVPLYVSLVPTQLHRLVASDVGRAALEPFAAVLVGGSSLTAINRPRNVVETYGATESAGGCVYDGAPLDGVAVTIDADGRVEIGGPTLADGYADGDNSDFHERSGMRWFRTSDVGMWDGRRLEVSGRADDVIVTGAFKVHPSTVERAMAGLPGVHEVVVVGIPDDEWGTRVVALVVPTPGASAPSTEDTRAALAELPRFARPREVRQIGTIPLLASGKIDRMAAQHWAQSGA